MKINFGRWANPDHEYSIRDDNYVFPEYEALFEGNQGDEVNVVGKHEVEFILNSH